MASNTTCPQCGESDSIWADEALGWYCDNCNLEFGSNRNDASTEAKDAQPTVRLGSQSKRKARKRHKS